MNEETYRQKLNELSSIRNRILLNLRRSDQLQDHLDSIRAEKKNLLDQHQSILKELRECEQDRYTAETLLLKRYLARRRQLEAWLNEAADDIMAQDIPEPIQFELSACIHQVTDEVENLRFQLMKLQSKSISRLSKLPNWILFAQRLVQMLMSHKDSAPFRQPVDWKSLNIPEYRDIIKYPMDLAMIHMKLDQHVYTCLEELIDDARQIFKNCYLFNYRHDPIVFACQRLELDFEVFIREAVKELLI